MIIWICGRIASGKTEVMKILKKNGFCCVYADEIVRTLYIGDNRGVKAVKFFFGDKFVGKKGVNRKLLREVVFNSPSKLRFLNKIIHPLVYEEIEKIISKNVGDVAVEAVYVGNDEIMNFVDKVIWIERKKSEIENVLIKKRGFSPEIASKTIGYIKKPKNVDVVVKNHGTLKELKVSVEKLFQH